MMSFITPPIGVIHIVHPSPCQFGEQKDIVPQHTCSMPQIDSSNGLKTDPKSHSSSSQNSWIVQNLPNEWMPYRPCPTFSSLVMGGVIVAGQPAPKMQLDSQRCWSQPEIGFQPTLDPLGVLGSVRPEDTLQLGWRGHWPALVSEWILPSIHRDGSIEKWVEIGIE